MRSSRRWRLRAAIVITLAVAASMVLWTPSLAGATFTVTRFDDPVPGPCQPADCSLREAVMAANATQEADIIRLPSGRYELSIPLAGPDYGWESDEMGDLDISQTVTIRNIGPGAVAVVDANGGSTGDRAFEISLAAISAAAGIQGGPYVQATFIDLGVTGGVASPDGEAAERGGGIRVNRDVSLTMDGGFVDRNFAYHRGGGIFVDQGLLTLSNVRLVDNEATSAGGAIAQVRGRVEIVDSVVRGNDGGLHGGALDSNGLGIVTRTLLRGNEAAAGAGAIAVYGCGSVRLTNSTISANRPNGAIIAHNGTVSLAYSTVTDNVGIGLYVDDVDGDGCPGEAYLRGTILAANRVPGAGNVPRDCLNDDEQQLIHSRGHNLVGDGTGCDLTAATGDQIGTHAGPIDARLAPLAFNGGALPSLLSHRLRPGSPALDSGDPGTGCGAGLPADQRGVPRSLGGRCDKGAYERVECRGALVNRVGTSGRDVAGDPRMRPTTGNDGVLGLGGNDSLAGEDGDDGLCGGGGRDRLSGGHGDDGLAGGPDRDECLGGAGTDAQVGCEVTRGIP